MRRLFRRKERTLTPCVFFEASIAFVCGTLPLKVSARLQADPLHILPFNFVTVQNREANIDCSCLFYG